MTDWASVQHPKYGYPDRIYLVMDWTDERQLLVFGDKFNVRYSNGDWHDDLTDFALVESRGWKLSKPIYEKLKYRPLTGELKDGHEETC